MIIAFNIIIKMQRSERKARKILMNKILQNSWNKQDFEVAKLQWRGIEYLQDSSCSSVCECTKKDIKRLWVIFNAKTRKTMKWIGNCCIQHFQIQLAAKRHKRNVLAIKDNLTLDQMWSRSEKVVAINDDTNSIQL